MPLKLTIRAFEHGKRIPDKHTCDGDDTSPEIRWDEVPDNTVSFALICEDPDAPGTTFTHWIVYNLPADQRQLDETIPVAKNLDNGGIHGKNDFGKYGYRGPCPPKGENHRYFFRLYALKRKLDPESARNRNDFYEAIKGHVLDEDGYMGTYSH